MWPASSSSSSSSSYRPTSSISDGSASIQWPATSIQLATHFSVPTTSYASSSKSAAILQPTPIATKQQQPSKSSSVDRRIGRLTASTLARIVDHCALSDVPQLARSSRALASVCMSDDRAWQRKCAWAGVSSNKRDRRRSQVASPRLNNGQGDDDDEFGAFSEIAIATSPPPPRRSNGFSPNPSSHSSGPRLCSSYIAYRAHCLALAPYLSTLRASTSTSPSQILTSLFPPSSSPTLESQATTLQLLLRHLSDTVAPTHDWGWLRQVLTGVCDRFESTCLAAFEKAEARQNRSEAELAQMKVAAEASWAIWRTLRATSQRVARKKKGVEEDGDASDWELGRVWVEKREVFYEAGKWDSGQNILRRSDSSGTIHQLDFSPMSEFIAALTRRVLVDGQEAVTVFPGRAGAAVIKAYTERLATDVIAEYINPLLSQCRLLSQNLFLTACAASFVQAWPIVDVVLSVTGHPVEGGFRSYRMFESNMDEYLEEEADWTKQTLTRASKAWEQQIGAAASSSSANAATTPSTTATFLSSSNPDQVKRNVLAGFRDVLLLPVTIVPATVSYGASAIASGGQKAVNGLSMLNPQKWMQTSNATVTTTGGEEVAVVPAPTIAPSEDITAVETVTSAAIAASSSTSSSTFEHFQLLLSLDVVLELIQADRESLKRVETFSGYPGRYGRKVRETIEEVFVLLLRDVGQRHVAPGFRKAIDQMTSYRPDDSGSGSVAPLLQFFELVHVGDTIQSMLQVYFDKELASYIDKTDFLNAAMQEKKRFEATLDESVAAGLNAGIEVLMNQVRPHKYAVTTSANSCLEVEHIIQTHTKPGEYCPAPDAAPLDLGSTEGCRDAIACLSMHCDLLRGSTSKEVLEVFYQEVGLRLHSIVQKHIKRQIISLEGGFQMIADINAYYAFVASLKQARITEEFEGLKMIGHVYIVEDAKDLAAIVRDASRYGGTFRPEDLYEFIQRRSDWKKIERTVDKAMYAISVKEDCVIM